MRALGPWTYRPAMVREVSSCAVWLMLGALALSGCDDKKPSMADALAESDAKEAKRKADAEAAKKAAKPVKDPNVLAMPWTVDGLKEGLSMGMQLEYALTGTDAKGKPVEDTYTGKVKANNASDVGVVAYRGTQASEPIATQVATLSWSTLSPFFSVERPSTELVRKESITTPAGTFDTVVVEVKGFFGAHRTVWMVADKPGVYAQVVDHGTATDEADQTELTYVLTSVAAGG